MPDVKCWTCKEPWDIPMESDASVEEVRKWAVDNYGEGFDVVSVEGLIWAVQRCPCCPEGMATVSEMDEELYESMLDSI